MDFLLSNTAQIFLTVAVLFGVFYAFVTEKMPSYLVAMTGMSILLFFGALDSTDMLNVFSNSAPITIACMFVISAALVQTGVIDAIGRFLIKMTAINRYLGVIVMFFMVLIVSAFMNNTPVVIILTPVFIALARQLKAFPSKYLIPLSYISILGGACTMIGTSTNILVNSIAQENGLPAFNMFDITIPGMIMATSGILFIALFGRFLLPERQPPIDALSAEQKAKRFLAEATIQPESHLIGKTLNEINLLESDDYEIIDLIRYEQNLKKNGAVKDETIFSRFFAKKTKSIEVITDAPIISTFRDTPLSQGDKIVFRLNKDAINELQDYMGINFDPQKNYMGEFLPFRKTNVIEAIIPPNSNFIGYRIKDLGIRRSYGCFIIGVHRKDKNIIGDLANIILRDGDSIILEGAEHDLERFMNNQNVLDASQVRNLDIDTAKAPIALITLGFVVGLSAVGLMPIHSLALIGAMIVILTRCVTPEEAYKTIEWRILLLIFGMLGIGAALQNTGAAAMTVDYLVNLIKDFGPLFILAAVYILTSILTEIVTNNAVAILLTPIVMTVTTTLGYDPTPFIVAIMFGASASFATPIGYQTNTFVYAAGGYKFMDFVKIGLPMNILMFVVAMIIIPMFWSF